MAERPDGRGVFELRVHGVSGTPPEELLARPLVDRVAGDAIAGFYVPHLFAERTDSYPVGVPDPEVPGPPMEGYVWGGLTSGAPSRAFWLLLLPFTLINVAPRLRPADPDGAQTRGARSRVWLLWLCCRLLAFTLTAVFVAAFAGIGDDLIGWQCGGGRYGSCAKATPGWLFRMITDQTTPHRLAIGTLVPLLGVFALWFVSKRSATRYEAVNSPLHDLLPAEPGSDDGDPVEASEVGLRSRWMWDNDRPVRRLRTAHVQLALAAALWFASAPMKPAWRWGDAAVVAAIVAYVLVGIASPSFVGHGDSKAWQRASNAAWVVVFVAFAASLAWLIFCDHPLDGRYRGTSLPRYADTILNLLFAELGVLLVLVVTVWLSSRRAAAQPSLGEPGPKAGLLGQGTAVLAVMGIFLAAVFTSGVYLYSAAWLHTGSLKPGFAEISRISHGTFTVPEAILDASFAYALSVAVLGLTVVGVLLFVVVSLHRISSMPHPMVRGAFESDYPGRTRDGRGKTILTAMWFGRVVDLVAAILGRLMFVGAVLTYVVAIMLLAEHWFGAGAAARWLLDRNGGKGRFFSQDSLQGTGAYLVVFSLLLLIAMGAAAFRVGSTRRSVGILWDLASFWPRLGHPLAAPCYAERTVPDLAQRMRWHVGEGRHVVLAAHSQGSVIGTAAILQLRTRDEFGDESPVLPHVGYLTFGCVLRRLYGRYFPAYFGPRTLGDLHTSLLRDDGDQRWRNLWRYTDYLGGPILSGPPPLVAPAWDPSQPDPVGPGGLRLDLHLIDPPYDRAPGDPTFPPPLRHSSYWYVPQFQRAVVRVGDL